MTFIEKINNNKLTITIQDQFVYICIIDFDTSIIQGYIKIFTDLSFKTSLNFKLPNKINSLSDLEKLINLLESENNFYFLRQKACDILNDTTEGEDNLIILLSLDR